MRSDENNRQLELNLGQTTVAPSQSEYERRAREQAIARRLLVRLRACQLKTERGRRKLLDRFMTAVARGGLKLADLGTNDREVERLAS